MAFFLICGGPRWTMSLLKMTFILKCLLNEHTKFVDNVQQKKLLYNVANLATFKSSDLSRCAWVKLWDVIFVVPCKIGTEKVEKPQKTQKPQKS